MMLKSSDKVSYKKMLRGFLKEEKEGVDTYTSFLRIIDDYDELRIEKEAIKKIVVDEMSHIKILQDMLRK